MMGGRLEANAEEDLFKVVCKRKRREAFVILSGFYIGYGKTRVHE